MIEVLRSTAALRAAKTFVSATSAIVGATNRRRRHQQARRAKKAARPWRGRAACVRASCRHNRLRSRHSRVRSARAHWDRYRRRGAPCGRDEARRLPAARYRPLALMAAMSSNNGMASWETRTPGRFEPRNGEDEGGGNSVIQAVERHTLGDAERTARRSATGSDRRRPLSGHHGIGLDANPRRCLAIGPTESSVWLKGNAPAVGTRLPARL